MVDMYYALYGVKGPCCLPHPEMASLLKPQKFVPASSSIKRDRSPSPIEFKHIPLDEKIPLSNNSREGSPIKEEIIIESIEQDKMEILIEDDKSAIKLEEIINLDDNNSMIPIIPETPPQLKKPKTDYYSDNSISLPGIQPSTSSISNFDGMFSKIADPGMDDSKSGKSADPNKPKKKKKDKKKHKHKHKHKHNKDKDREKSKEKKDPNISRVIKEENQETLSSNDSSSRDSHGTTTMDLTI